MHLGIYFQACQERVQICQQIAKGIRFRFKGNRAHGGDMARGQGRFRNKTLLLQIQWTIPQLSTCVAILNAVMSRRFLWARISANWVASCNAPTFAKHGAFNASFVLLWRLGSDTYARCICSGRAGTGICLGGWTRGVSPWWHRRLWSRALGRDTVTQAASGNTKVWVVSCFDTNFEIEGKSAIIEKSAKLEVEIYC